MKEVEVKAKIENKAELLDKLHKLGCLCAEPTIQDDTIFIHKKDSFVNSAPGTNFLRIRKAKGKAIFTLKQSSPENELAKIEKETEIENADTLKEALELMGYKEAVRVRKTREKTRYGEYEICIDEVKDLGFFIEVEKMTNENPEAAQEEMFQFLETLGIKREDRVLSGYDRLVYARKNS